MRDSSRLMVSFKSFFFYSEKNMLYRIKTKEVTPETIVTLILREEA